MLYNAVFVYLYLYGLWPEIKYYYYYYYNINNKQIYLQPHRVGFTYTVIYKQNKMQGNKMRRNVIRKVIHTATQRDTQSYTYFH